MRLGATKTGATTTYNGLGDQLYDNSGARPTLDLNFASNGSLVDSVTGKTLVTHTRQSNATYVDGDGIIKDAALNYLKYSENIGFSGWNVRSGTTATANQEAPNGSNTATLITHSSGDGYVWRNDAGFSAGGEFVLSVYAKKVSGTPTLTPSMWLGTATGASSDPAASVTDEWVRYDFNVTRQYLAGGQDYGFLVKNGSVLLWGAQLEQSSTAGEYVKTTSTINSAPRFDHNPTTGESLGLLVEESRENLLPYSEEFDNVAWSTSSLTITADDATAPDGTQTADKWLNTSTTGIISNAISKAASAITYTASLWVKSSDATSFSLTLDNGGTGDRGRCIFNITTGELVSTTDDGAFTGTSGTITAYPDSWYRLTVTTTTDTGTTLRWRAFSSGSGDIIYIWGAQLEAGSFPTSYIRTTGSTATRSADVASIEGNDFGTFNLLQYSEEFDQSSWSKGNASIIPNSEQDPSGSFSADKLVEDTQDPAPNNHRIQQGFTSTSGNYTFSVYAKQGERSSVRLGFFSSTDGARFAWFDLATGVKGTASPTITSSITDVGNGWYRCVISYSVSHTGSGINSNIMLGNPNETESYVGDGTSGLYLWGAQLEQSSTATPYVKSDVTFTSRGSTATYYDYNGIIRTAAVDEARNVAFLPDGSGNFVSAGELLLEDAGTNGIKYSEDFTAAGWGVQNGATRTANDGEAPDGTQTANTVNLTSATSSAVYTNVGSELVGNKTLSFYVKHVSGSNTFRLARYNSADAILQSSDFTATTEWQRFDFQFTATAAGFIYFFNDSANSAGTFLVWGAQLETGSYATSYIPTYGSTATRAADVSSSSSNTFGNSFYNQTEGTVFADAISPPTSESTLYRVFGVSDGTLNNRFVFYRNGSTNLAQVFVGASGSTPASFTEANWSDNSRLKMIVAARAASINASFGGSSETEDTSASIPVVDRAFIGLNESGSSSLFWNSTIARLTYWPTRLSNDTLQTITV